MSKFRLVFIVAGVAALVSARGCDSGDLSAVKVRLAADGSGTLTITSLARAAAPDPASDATQGVTWSIRAVATHGEARFAKIGDVRVADIVFEPLMAGPKIAGVRVRIPAGEARTWSRTLVPATAEDRDAVARLLDPGRSPPQIGIEAKIEIHVPGTPVAANVRPETTGVTSSFDEDGKFATLLLPVDLRAPSTASELVWDVTWK